MLYQVPPIHVSFLSFVATVYIQSIATRPNHAGPARIPRNAPTAHQRTKKEKKGTTQHSVHPPGPRTTHQLVSSTQHNKPNPQSRAPGRNKDRRRESPVTHVLLNIDATFTLVPERQKTTNVCLPTNRKHSAPTSHTSLASMPILPTYASLRRSISIYETLHFVLLCHAMPCHAHAQARIYPLTMLFTRRNAAHSMALRRRLFTFRRLRRGRNAIG